MEINQMVGRVRLAALFGLTFFCCHESGNAQNNTKPNIIHILADDVGFDDLSCFGSKDINTPNLDAFSSLDILIYKTKAWINISKG